MRARPAPSAGADSDFFAAHDGACQQKIRNVGAGDQHQRANGRDQHQQRRFQIAGLSLGERLQIERELGIHGRLVG